MPLELTVDHPLLLASAASHMPFVDPRSKSSSSSSDSSDVKSPAQKSVSDKIEINKQVKQLYNILQFATGIRGCDNRRKSHKTHASATASSENKTVDIVSNCACDGALERFSNLLPASSREKADGNLGSHLSWVEVLCYEDDGADDNHIVTPSAKPKRRGATWVSIDVALECFDRPEDFESILAWAESRSLKVPDQRNAMTISSCARNGEMGGRSMSSPKSVRQWHRTNANVKKSPVSYVLAVEHCFLCRQNVINPRCGSLLRGVRFTDVTPRYASAWSRTLRLRGATGKEIAAGRGRCVDEWWQSTLKRVNAHCRGRSERHRIAIAASKISTAVRSVTKAKTNAGREVEMIELESTDDDDKAASQTDCSDFDDDEERMESKDLAGTLQKEKIPTSKAQFKISPFYVVPSILTSRDVLHPDAHKNICGVFKGELVYRRSDVSKALTAARWLYSGRKVKASEFGNPAKQIKARKKTAAKGFQALLTYGVSDEAQREMISSMNFKGREEDVVMDDLYGEWQTEQWSPPYVGPDEAIPTNEYRNVEKALINPGLTHIDKTGLAPIARKLGIPYAPCMVGYDGQGGNRTATIRGIVVHDHNVALIREASVEWESHVVEVEHIERRDVILRRWRRLVVGILTKERLDRQYG
jgi:hypothetical protein